MTMKKVLKYLSFFAILIVLILGASYVFSPKNYDPFKVQGEIARRVLGEEANTLDVIVLGDSETFVSFVPDMFDDATGLSSMICGSTGQFLWSTLLRLETILETQSPGYLFVETNEFFSDMSLLGEFKNAAVATVQYKVPFFLYHDRWQFVINDSPYGPEGTRDNTRGYRDNGDIFPYEGGEYMIPTDACAPMGRISTWYLNRLKKTCDENGILLILYSSPSATNWSYPKHNTVENWANANGINFFDSNVLLDELGIDWSMDTRDYGDHVNKYGAVKVTDYLIKCFNEKVLGDASMKKCGESL